TKEIRALLNFGHTIGHGIEAALPYGEMLHGEAVSLGLRAALHLSERHAGLRAEDAARILSLLDRFKLPLHLDDRLSDEAILERLGRDKKFEAGKFRFVLIRSPGDAFVSKEIAPDDLAGAI